MNTTEGYKVIKLSPYEVYPPIYKGLKLRLDDVSEKGFSGFVQNPNLDDRFICSVFCIWNAIGDLVYNGREWGEFKHYKLQDIK